MCGSRELEDGGRRKKQEEAAFVAFNFRISQFPFSANEIKEYIEEKSRKKLSIFIFNFSRVAIFSDARMRKKLSLSPLKALFCPTEKEKKESAYFALSPRIRAIYHFKAQNILSIRL